MSEADNHNGKPQNPTIASIVLRAMLYGAFSDAVRFAFSYDRNIRRHVGCFLAVSAIVAGIELYRRWRNHVMSDRRKAHVIEAAEAVLTIVLIAGAFTAVVWGGFNLLISRPPIQGTGE